MMHATLWDQVFIGKSMIVLFIQRKHSILPK